MDMVKRRPPGFTQVLCEKHSIVVLWESPEHYYGSSESGAFFHARSRGEGKDEKAGNKSERCVACRVARGRGWLAGRFLKDFNVRG